MDDKINRYPKTTHARFSTHDLFTPHARIVMVRCCITRACIQGEQRGGGGGGTVSQLTDAWQALQTLESVRNLPVKAVQQLLRQGDQILGLCGGEADGPEATSGTISYL